MSLENQPSSTQSSEVMGMDPLQCLLTSSEDSDWESAFMGAISNPYINQESDQINWRIEPETTEPASQYTGNELVHYEIGTASNIYNNTSEDNSTELRNIEKIELDINVNHSTHVPKGSVTLASIPIIKEDKLLQNTWTPQVEPNSGCHLFLHNKPVETQACLPLHLVEGREDPEKDEGFVSPRNDSPILSRYAPIYPEKKPPILEELKPTFFDNCNILQWAIDDQNIQDPPGIEREDNKEILKNEEQEIKTSSLNANKEEYVYIIDEPVPSTSSMSPIDFQPTTLQDSCDYASKRKRGRPPNLTPRKITPKLPKSRPSSQRSDSEASYLSDSASGMTDNEMSALKYRRMRDLNNEASKRCREARKRRQADKEDEVNKLKMENQRLYRKVEAMENQIKRLKLRILSEVRNPARYIAIARRRRRLQDEINSLSFQNFQENDQDQNELPDANVLWSI